MATKKPSTAPKGATASRQAKIQAASKNTRQGPSPVTIAGVIAILTIIAVVAWVIISDQSAKKAAEEGGSAVPAGASAMGQPLVLGTAKEGAPVLDVYEDFQCPGCGNFEKILGPTVKELANSGEAQVRYHVMTFLDSNFPGDNSNRAANAAFCAAADGKFGAMHDAIYAGQPATEGEGWTDAQFTEFAGTAGLTGAALDAWKTCFNGKATNQYVESMQEATSKDGVSTTPTVKLNGEVMDLAGLDPAKFKAAVLAG